MFDRFTLTDATGRSITSSHLGLLLGAIAGDTSAPALPPLAPGVRVGPFEIVGPLAQGGMGAVYVARPIDADGRRVALKTLRVSDAQAAEALTREIRAAQRVHHPGVVRVLASGEDAGQPWYAMELIDGDPLGAAWTALVRGEAPDAHVAQRGLDIALHIALALAWLHAEGIVHRDLKPSNVMLRCDGTPALIDLGLAVPIAHPPSPTGRTREAMVWGLERAGTPDYMAPEQRRGEPVDVRADLYALGRTMAWMQRVFAAARPDAAPPAWADLIETLSAPDAAARASSAEDVAERLRASGARSAWSAPTAHTLFRAPLIGRDAHLARFEAWRSDPDGPTALILDAAPGMGRTRLALEAIRAAHLDGWRALSSQADPSDSASIGVWRDVIERAAALLIDDTACAKAAPSPFAPSVWLLARYAPRLRARLNRAPAPPHPPAQRAGDGDDDDPLHERLAQGLDALIHALASRAPLLLVLDDMHWASTLAVRTLAALCRRLHIRAAPVRVLVTSWAEHSPALRDALNDTATSHTLDPLPPPAVAQLARRILAWPDAPKALLDAVNAVSEGNPLFTTEYLDAAVRRGVFTRQGGLWAWRGADTLAALPRSIRLLLQQRVEALADDQRALLNQAAVVGRECSHTLLQRCTALPPDALSRLLATLERARFIVRSSQDRVRLAHHGLIDACLAALPAPHTRALHARVARAASDALHLLPGGLFQLAAHHEHSGDLTAAQRTYRASAAQAHARHELDLLDASLQRAIALDLGSAPRLLAHDLLHLIEHVLVPRWDAQRAQALLDHLHTLTGLDAPLEARISIASVRIDLHHQRPHHALAHALRARALAQHLPPQHTPLHVHALVALSDALIACERLDDAADVGRLAASIADGAALHALAGEALGAVQRVMNLRTQDAEAIALGHAIRQRLQDADRPFAFAMATLRLAKHLAHTGELDQARALLNEAHQHASPLHSARFEMEWCIAMSLCDDIAGDLQGALDHKTRALPHARVLGDTEALSYTLSLIGHAHIRLRNYDQARACFERVQAITPPDDLRRHASIAQGFAFIALGAEDTDAVVRWGERALDLRMRTGAVRTAAQLAAFVADALARVGRLDQALRLCDTAFAALDEADANTEHNRTFIYPTRATIHRLMGDPAQARAHIDPCIASSYIMADPASRLSILSERALIARDLGEPVTPWWRRAHATAHEHPECAQSAHQWLWLALSRWVHAHRPDLIDAPCATPPREDTP